MRPAPAGPAARSSAATKPEFDLGGLDVEARRVHHERGKLVPVARAIAGFLALDHEEELALRDDADVLRVVAVRLDHRTLRIGGEEHIAVLRLQLEGVERAFGRR